MSWRWPSQNTFGMWTVLYWTRSSRTQFGVSINVRRLSGGTLWTLLVTFYIVMIRCTETFWSPCIKVCSYIGRQVCLHVDFTVIIQGDDVIPFSLILHWISSFTEEKSDAVSEFSCMVIILTCIFLFHNEYQHLWNNEWKCVCKIITHCLMRKKQKFNAVVISSHGWNSKRCVVFVYFSHT